MKAKSKQQQQQQKYPCQFLLKKMNKGFKKMAGSRSGTINGQVEAEASWHHQQGATKTARAASNPRSQCKETSIGLEWTSWTATMLMVVDKSISDIVKYMSLYNAMNQNYQVCSAGREPIGCLGKGQAEGKVTHHLAITAWSLPTDHMVQKEKGLINVSGPTNKENWQYDNIPQ